MWVHYGIFDQSGCPKWAKIEKRQNVQQNTVFTLGGRQIAQSGRFWPFRKKSGYLTAQVPIPMHLTQQYPIFIFSTTFGD